MKKRNLKQDALVNKQLTHSITNSVTGGLNKKPPTKVPQNG